jgi:hypothetical protein
LGWNREDLIIYKSYMDLILIIPTHSFSSPMPLIGTVLYLIDDHTANIMNS